MVTLISQCEKKALPRTRRVLDAFANGIGDNTWQTVITLEGLDAVRKLLRQSASKNPRFRWQNKAYKMAVELQQSTARCGSFGINMASTGYGKTFANAKIMYGLADSKTGCRFSVALGLRTLTLQTGTALRERLQLSTDDLAVLIGSQAVKALHEFHQETTPPAMIKKWMKIPAASRQSHCSQSNTRWDVKVIYMMVY